VPNYQFGSGVLVAVPNAGNLAANPTPYMVGTLQECNINVKGDIKKLWGQQQMAVAKARGKIDVTCKGKFATQDPTMLNQLYWGQTQTTGMQILAANEAWTIGGGSPPAATVTVTNAANATTDFGVLNAATGQQFQKVPGTPAIGQYSAPTPFLGVYTFSAADEAAKTQIYISYTWLNAARGTTVALVNQFMGYAPEFQAFLFNSFQSQIMGIQLNSCMMGTFSIPTKQEDFWISDLEFDASCDAAGVLGYMYADLG
jgi:hypothetical protein